MIFKGGGAEKKKRPVEKSAASLSILTIIRLQKRKTQQHKLHGVLRRQGRTFGFFKRKQTHISAV